MPKATTPTAVRQGRRHNPLEDDLVATGPLRAKAPKRKSRSGDDDEEQENYVDSKASKKILKIGRELAEEIDVAPPRPPKESNAFGFDSRFDEDGEDNEAFVDEEVWGDEEEIVEEIEIEPEDLDTFNKFLPTDDDPLLTHGWGGQASAQQQGPGTNLADLILARIAEHEAGDDRGREVGPVDDDFEIPPKVVEVYTKIGLILSRYKSGQLPKPFKILPTVPHWEDIIQYTNPDQWTPNACYQATRIFVSSNPIVVRRFMEMILLERVREDIHETKKLNVHLFNALKKALYKPAAWFKGFLFPLVESGTCTLREATIISAVLARVSIPVLHSGAAIKGLCDIAAREASAGTEGGGATNVFIKTLLEKKYALPYQVVDSLVFHFLRFRSVDPASVREGAAMDIGSERAAMQVKLPVIWHQCLLAFAQRYRNEITEDQREALLDLLLTHGHHKIGPEIRRELLAGRGRGVVVEQPASAFDGDDTMMVVDG
ncbi:Bystin-domain-containing protein [Daldinia vernicosa]|uniref:Bystin-domain-containing protein n=1 Tax=Daldinia vernicosa TaxID=114800 RepID=UPI002008DDAF|nr:Bystin-domain-containing protein [Daldinia vernicosa]KAI0852526.1 Bystin-domain-containing protein [Daldinia vernicosa]